MAKLELELSQPITLPYEYRNPNIRECPCGCGPIEKGEHIFIESKATGKWYGDVNCLIDAEGWRHSADYQRIYIDGEKYTQKEFKKLYEVTVHE